MVSNDRVFNFKKNDIIFDDDLLLIRGKTFGTLDNTIEIKKIGAVDVSMGFITFFKSRVDMFNNDNSLAIAFYNARNELQLAKDFVEYLNEYSDELENRNRKKKETKSIIKDLKELGSLRDKKIITEDEFYILKNKLLKD